jgi:hypothetical protein
MHDALLQNHYCVAALQPLFSYNAGMSLSANQQGDEPEPATRRAVSPQGVRGRFSRAFFLMAALVAVGLLAACGTGSFLSVRDSTALAATSSTISDLDRVGYRNAGIGLESGSGLPAGGLVDVSYSDGPAANAEINVYNVERIVWHTLRYRFGVLNVSQTSGGCARGSFCASSSTEIGSQTYAQLRGEFGSRPAGLDKTSVSQTDPMPSWLPDAVCVLAVSVVAAVLWTRRRGRQAGAPDHPVEGTSGAVSPASAGRGT